MDRQFEIALEGSGHGPARLALLDRVMGPQRLRRTCERLREGREPLDGLSLVALGRRSLVGTVRLWGVRACGLSDGVLLGPLAVDSEHQGLGVGAALLECSIRRISARGNGAVILVGDASYYGRFGFSAHAARRLSMPGPFERHRLLALELRDGALDRAHGVLRPSSPDSIRHKEIGSAVAA